MTQIFPNTDAASYTIRECRLCWQYHRDDEPCPTTHTTASPPTTILCPPTENELVSVLRKISEQLDKILEKLNDGK